MRGQIVGVVPLFHSGIVVGKEMLVGMCLMRRQIVVVVPLFHSGIAGRRGWWVGEAF